MGIDGKFEQNAVGVCIRKGNNGTEALVADMRVDATNALAGMMHFPGGPVTFDKHLGPYTEIGIPLEDTAIRKHMEKVGIQFVIDKRVIPTTRFAPDKRTGTRSVITYWFIGHSADPDRDLIVDPDCEVVPGSARWVSMDDLLGRIEKLGDYATGRLPNEILQFLVASLRTVEIATT